MSYALGLELRRLATRILVPGQAQLRTMAGFRVVEHVVKCQHTRDRPAGAELGRDNNLRLRVKQYVPEANKDPKPGDVTLIGAQANAFPKEMYEPLWEDIHERLLAKGRNLRGIWVADIASQGQSGITNESLLGPDASWWDHGRDLLFLINQFQDEISHPIIGVGHSVGASHLTYLSLLHPRLLHGLVLIDPIMQRDLGPHKAMARLSTSRRDVWPSRDAAASKFASSKFYQKWDARVLEKWIQYGLRDLPTEQYPEEPQRTNSPQGDPPVTLSTTKAQEVYFYIRAVYPEERMLQPEDRNLLQDVHPDDQNDFPFARPESQELYRRLPEVQPSVLYVFGDKSDASPENYRRSKMELTGTGVGGSGGATKGRVQEVVLNCGHLVAMERPKECADASASFIDRELSRWEAEERERHHRWDNLSRGERVDINDQWRQQLGESPPPTPPNKEAEAEKDRKASNPAKL